MSVRAGSITVVGMPITQGSKAAFVMKRKGAIGSQKSDYRAVMREGKSAQGLVNLQAWRHAVTAAAQAWVKDNFMSPPIDGPVEVKIGFYLQRPASLPARVELHSKKPDIDKLARAVLDALTGVIFADDGRIFRLHVSKWYADGRPPGAEISWEAH